MKHFITRIIWRPWRISTSQGYLCLNSVNFKATHISGKAAMCNLLGWAWFQNACHYLKYHLLPQFIHKFKETSCYLKNLKPSLQHCVANESFMPLYIQLLLFHSVFFSKKLSDEPYFYASAAAGLCLASPGKPSYYFLSLH